MVLQILQLYKEQLFNIVEAMQVLLLFVIINEDRKFIFKNKVKTVVFVIFYFIYGALIDFYFPKGFNALAYFFCILVSICYITRVKPLSGFIALLICFVIIFFSEIAAIFLEVLLFRKEFLTIINDSNHFIVYAIFTSILRFTLICILYRCNFKFRNLKILREFNLFLLATFIQIVILTSFAFFTYLRLYNKMPALFQTFCYIITLISFFLSLIQIKAKEKQLKLSYELEYKEKLAVANERNRISREVHDTLGHTLTLLITLTNVSKINVRNNPDEAEEKLNQASNIAANGLKQLKTSISGWMPEKLSANGIICELKKLIEESRSVGVEVEFSVYGEEYYSKADYSEIIYRICQEAITNSMRHGKASKVIIILKFSLNKLQLFILDNGTGCKEIKKGFGLVGMEERINNLNGTLSYGTSGDKGFNIHIEIPIGGVCKK